MNEELLVQLAAKLGTTTEYLWDVLIRDRIVNAAGGIFWVVLFGLFVAGLSRMPKWVKIWEETDLKVFWAWYAVALLLYVIIGSLIFVSSIQALVHPEGSAFKYILNILR